MTHHPNTPASRNEEVAAVLQSILADACESESETNVSAELYRRGVKALAASRTEQAAPSVASGVEKAGAVALFDDLKLFDAPPQSVARPAAIAWLHYAAKKPSLRRVDFHAVPGVVEQASGWKTIPLGPIAAPGAAIAASEQEALDTDSAEGLIDQCAQDWHDWQKQGNDEDRTAWLASRKAAVAYFARALASRQEAPAASAGHLTREWDRALGNTRSPATVAQPVVTYSDSASRLHVGDSAFEDWYQNYLPNSVGHKQIARDAYAAGMGDPLVIARDAAQPCPSQGCGGAAVRHALQQIVDADDAQALTQQLIEIGRAALSGLEHVGKESE